MPPLKENQDNNPDKKYWRSFDELQQTPEFISNREREFPENASELTDPLSRRSFVKIMGASMALAGMTGCSLRRPEREIHPYAQSPEHVIPGKPLFYATAMNLGEEVVGLLVESHEGRPTKIEGNPQHPSSLGATRTQHQASILDLYDPDRLQSPLDQNQTSTWQNAEGALASLKKHFAGTEGAGLALLSEIQVSPTYFRLIKQLRKKFPKIQIYHYDPLNLDSIVEGLYSVTGERLLPLCDIEDARIVISFDADFLNTDPESIAATRGFSARRNPTASEGMSRLYVFESHYTLSGSKADHRFRLKCSQIEYAVWLLAATLIKEAPELLISVSSPELVTLIATEAEKMKGLVPDIYLKSICEDLLKSKGQSVLLAGPKQPPTVHGLLYLINLALGNTGKTIHYAPKNFADDPAISRSQTESIASLTKDLSEKKITALCILGGNPVYNAPADLNFAEALKQAKSVIHLTTARNDTSELCTWTLPRTHYLESWGDAQSLDGTLSVVQPLIAPLYEGRSDIEFISHWLGEAPDGYTLVRSTWMERQKSGNFENFWRQWLHEGIISGPAPIQKNLPYRDHGLIIQLQNQMKTKAQEKSGLEAVFYPDSKIVDGRFANNGWLQELPDPIHKLTWDNAVLLSPATAKQLGINKGDLIKITHQGVSIAVAAWLEPGHADQSLSLFLGYGQHQIGRIGKPGAGYQPFTPLPVHLNKGQTAGGGFNVYPLRSSRSMAVIPSVQVEKLGITYPLASTQNHWSMEGRPQYREATLEEFRKDPHFAEEQVEVSHGKDLWKEHEYKDGYQWGMVVDLSRCTGCNACITGCQSENNIPIVGKKEVLNGREMHWIRVDRYFEGNADEAKLVEQPVTCLQCENAPCEQVCPVAATTHSDEGLNDMAYNRCIGTRYCMNNCPVKVRRFNFYDYHQRNPQSVKKERLHLFDYLREPDKAVQMQFNPDVTVRMRGVMEKCTYCVQRINTAKIEAKNEGRPVEDGEIRTACQQACPAEAITFGNILDEKSKVAKLKKDSRNYQLLADLHLKPRTTYIANVRNPHPAVEKWELQRKNTA